MTVPDIITQGLKTPRESQRIPYRTVLGSLLISQISKGPCILSTVGGAGRVFGDTRNSVSRSVDAVSSVSKYCIWCEAAPGLALPLRPGATLIWTYEQVPAQHARRGDRGVRGVRGLASAHRRGAQRARAADSHLFFSRAFSQYCPGLACNTCKF